MEVANGSINFAVSMSDRILANDSRPMGIPVRPTSQKDDWQGQWGSWQVEDEYFYRVVGALDEVAQETGKTVPQIALNWL